MKEIMKKETEKKVYAAAVEPATHSAGVPRSPQGVPKAHQPAAQEAPRRHIYSPVHFCTAFL